MVHPPLAASNLPTTAGNVTFLPKPPLPQVVAPSTSTTITAPAPSSEPAAGKRPDVNLPVAPDAPKVRAPANADVQNVPIQKSEVPVPGEAGDTTQKQIEQESKERALEQARLDRQNAEAQRRAALMEAAQREAARLEVERADSARSEVERAESARQELARQAQLAAARQEAIKQESARQEQMRQEAARAEQVARSEATRLEAERKELARQEELRRETLRQQQATLDEKARQDAARQEQERLEAARREAERKEIARQEQAKQAQLEAARLAQNQQEAARQEAAKQEAARQEASKQEAARQEQAKKELAQRERADQEAEREKRLRAIGKQMDEEAAQRDAASRSPSRSLLPTVSSLRRGWLLGRADPNADLVQYAESMSRKIETNMTFDMVRDVVKQAHTRPTVTVAVRADGSVEKITFTVSSGVPAIDDAIRKVVASQASYGAFPPVLARQYDVVEIRRTWVFDTAIHLQ
jgi:hypothetical protein